MDQTTPLASGTAEPLSLDENARGRWLVKTIIIGTIIRLGVAAISAGSNDSVIWHDFAVSVARFGVLESYRREWALNHPPLMVIWSYIALRLGSDSWFSVFMKLPAIAADALACVILASAWMRRDKPHIARLAVMGIAYNPLAILVSGYHCNTDNLYAALSLLAMFFVANRAQFFYAGLALGAAINVKLIPVLLIPITFAMCRSRRDFLNLLAGLALWVIPFIPLATVATAIYHNMVQYIPPHERWGVQFILNEAPFNPDMHAKVIAAYRMIGRGLIILAVAALALVQWRRRRWNAYEAGLLTYAVFMVVTPGFGVQYTVMLLPLMLAVTIERAWVYSILCAIFLFIAYAMTLTEFRIPFFSYFRGPLLPMPGPLFGLIAWWVLGEMAVKLIRRPSSDN
jgi:hypothetical protein